MMAHLVVLVRHGVTDWNAEHRFQGRTDIPLNEEGRAQAEAMAVEVARTLHPTRIVCSDLTRARETAEAIGRAAGVKVTPDCRLQEINVGEWEGLTTTEIDVFAPGLLDGAADDFRWSATGETVREATDRVVPAIVDHASRAGDSDVLVVVAHGAVLRNACVRLLGLDGPMSLFGVMSNCGWAVLRPREDRWRLMAYNKTVAEG